MSRLTDERLAELKALAREALQTDDDCRRADDVGMLTKKMLDLAVKADAAFTSKADAATVHDLIAEVDELRAQVDRLNHKRGLTIERHGDTLRQLKAAESEGGGDE